ncbi:MAG: hypothetical protein ABIH63_03835 [archaeon]
MKCKITIVGSINRYNREINKKIRDGSLNRPEKGMIMTPETFNKVFSPERIKLLQRIYSNNVKNIYQLAKDLGKPYEVVFRNIKYLRGLGLVEIEEKGNKSIPYMRCKPSIDMFRKDLVEV